MERKLPFSVVSKAEEVVSELDYILDSGEKAWRTGQVFVDALCMRTNDQLRYVGSYIIQLLMPELISIQEDPELSQYFVDGLMDAISTRPELSGNTLPHTISQQIQKALS